MNKQAEVTAEEKELIFQRSMIYRQAEKDLQGAKDGEGEALRKLHTRKRARNGAMPPTGWRRNMRCRGASRHNGTAPNSYSFAWPESATLITIN